MNRPVARTRWGLCWGTVPHASATELVEAAADAGFHAVTLSQVSHADVLDDGGTALRAVLERTGVFVESVEPIIAPLPGLPPPAELPPDYRSFARTTTTDGALRMARAVGARSVNVAHFLGRPVERTRLVDAIGEIVLAADRDDIDVTLEFIPGTGIADLAAALAITAEVDHPRLRVLLDTWHLVRSGGGLADLATLPPRSLGGMQISDRGDADDEVYVPMSGRLMPGEGTLPLEPMLMAALTNSPGIVVCAEVFDVAHRDQPVIEVARRCARAMRSMGFVSRRR